MPAHVQQAWAGHESCCMLELAFLRDADCMTTFVARDNISRATVDSTAVVLICLVPKLAIWLRKWVVCSASRNFPEVGGRLSTLHPRFEEWSSALLLRRVAVHANSKSPSWAFRALRLSCNKASREAERLTHHSQKHMFS